jgi:1-acyl-sn-glycerol-3-phosphate acyltransferase
MIIKQIFLLILYFYFMIIYAYIITVPGLLISNKSMINYIRKLLQSLSTYILDNSDIKIYLSNNEKLNFIDNKFINIIICNHKSSLDFIILLTILEQLKINNFTFVLKKSINFIPGLGVITFSNDDIKLDRNWNLDKKNLDNQLDNINDNNYIIIFPEGTRFNKNLLLSGKQYSIDNNYPVYNNLLVPKSKGLFYIINYLNKRNKLGKIYDFSLIFPDFMNESIYLNNLFTKSIKSIYINIRELSLPNNLNTISDVDFKNWLLFEWENKDILISNYKNDLYDNIFLRYNKFNLKIVFLICIIGFFILTSKKRRMYLLISLIISYYIIYNKKN